MRTFRELCELFVNFANFANLGKAKIWRSILGRFRIKVLRKRFIFAPGFSRKDYDD